MTELPKKKALIVIPNLGRGGAQQVFRQHLTYLSGHFNVTGCVFNWDGSFLTDRTGDMISLDVPAGKTRWGKFWSFLVRVRRLRDFKKRLGIDVTISHLEGADYVNILSRVDDKIICWIHGTKKHDGNIEGGLGFFRKRFLIPFLYRRAHRIVTVSKGISEELVKSYPGLRKKLATVYNGFDLDKIIRMSDEPIEERLSSLFRQHKILITHCRLSRQKNLKALLRIFSRFPKQNQVKLVVVGDGELREELLMFCLSEGLRYWAVWNDDSFDDSAEVYFIGQQENPFKYLKRASLYLMTSGWEGFPLALCEALANGLPVISTDCFTGPREIIAPQIVSVQPVQEPYYTKFGALMPLVNSDDSMAIGKWVNEIQKMIDLNDSLSSKQVRVERISEFELSNSMNETIQIVNSAVNNWR